MKTVLLALANVRALWRRLLGLVVLIAISAAVCLSAFAISHRAESAADRQILQGYGNRSLQLDKLGDRPDSRLLNDTSLAQIHALPGVESVEPRTQASFGYKDNEIPGVLLYATTPRQSLAPPIVKSTRPSLFPLGAHEIVLPARGDGTDLSSLLGKQITVQVTKATAVNEGVGVDETVQVVGLFDPSWQIDGPDVAYLTSADVVTWAALRAGVAPADYARLVGYDRVSVVAANSAAVGPLLTQLQAAGFAACTLQQQLQALPGVLALIRSASFFLLAFLVLVTVLSAYLVTSSLARQRTREVGILKAVGFTDRRVFSLYLGEALGTALISAFCGLVAGIALASVGSSLLRRRADLRDYLPSGLLAPTAAAVGALFTVSILVVAAGALVPALRAARMQPADAIREW